jgi:hypothetical protein
MPEWSEIVDEMLMSAHELWFSVDKFTTYAWHVLNEQRRGESFSKNWHKWAPYLSLIGYLTQVVKPTDTTINVDEVIDMLCEILGSDIFEIDKEKYIKLYNIYKNLIPFWDKVYRENHKIARKRAIEVISWTTDTIVSKKVSEATNSIWIEIKEVIELFDNFCSLLREMSQNPSVIYISWYQDSIKPQYTRKILNLMEYLEHWEKSEVQITSQRHMKWTTRGNKMSELEISDWYNNLTQENIETILLDFGMFLFKKWELEWLPQRDEIVWYLMDLARKISKNRYAEILNLIQLENYNNQA